MSNTPSLVKNPYTKTVFKTDKELQDFIKCCDPDTGYLYFMDNNNLVRKEFFDSLKINNGHITI